LDSLEADDGVAVDAVVQSGRRAVDPAGARRMPLQPASLDQVRPVDRHHRGQCHRQRALQHVGDVVCGPDGGIPPDHGQHRHGLRRHAHRHSRLDFHPKFQLGFRESKSIQYLIAL